MKHQVFISYQHRAGDVADQIVTILEANGIPCWIDRSGIAVSEGWDERIG